MRSYHPSQVSSSADGTAADTSDTSSYGQSDDVDTDVMCLVYPDGSITMVNPEANPA